MESDSPVDSNLQAESGRRKRKASARSTDRASDRKRTQNRISQQCARERQTAYVRQMESFIDLLRSNTEGDSTETEYTKLLKAHLKLLDDKHSVEESLFRLRQKLLSVGNMATLAAEDPIFQSLNESTPAHSNPEMALQSGPSSNLEHLPTLGIAGPSSAVEKRPHHSHDDTSNMPVSDPAQEEASLGDLSPWQQDMDIFLRQYTAATQLSYPSIPNPMAFPALDSSWPLPQFPFSNTPMSINNLMGSLMGTEQPQVPAFVQITQSSTDGLMVINNSTIFADQVRSAAKHVMIMSMRSPRNHGGTNAPPVDSPEMVHKLASVAIEVIGALAGLQTYIYGVHFSKYMEYVMRWRISNSLEDRYSIPVPFRPTPLQAATPDHPMVIDFINWPSIRDHMILYSASLNLDAMCRDIVLNTVIELPQHQVAVNIYELFFTHILPEVRGGHGGVTESMIHNPEWVYLAVSPDKVPVSVPSSPSPTQEALAAEIADRMGLQLDDPTSCKSSLPQSSSMATPSRGTKNGLAAPCGPQMIMARALKSFGIDQPSNWKLSKDFARKYPNVDCSLDVSQFQMVSCKAVALGKAGL